MWGRYLVEGLGRAEGSAEELGRKQPAGLAYRAGGGGTEYQRGLSQRTWDGRGSSPSHGFACKPALPHALLSTSALPFTCSALRLLYDSELVAGGRGRGE